MNTTELAQKYEDKAEQLRTSCVRYSASDRDFFMGQAHAYARVAEELRKELEVAK